MCIDGSIYRLFCHTVTSILPVSLQQNQVSDTHAIVCNAFTFSSSSTKCSKFSFVLSVLIKKRYIHAPNSRYAAMHSIDEIQAKRQIASVQTPCVTSSIGELLGQHLHLRVTSSRIVPAPTSLAPAFTASIGLGIGVCGGCRSSLENNHQIQGHGLADRRTEVGRQREVAASRLGPGQRGTPCTAMMEDIDR